MRRPLAALALALALCAVPVTAEVPPKLLTWSQQMAVRDGWLAQRHARLLDMMRRHGFDWWVVVNEEFRPDPLTPLVAPARPYVGNRDVLVFVDAGARGLRRVAITGYAEESLARFFESPDDPKPLEEALPALYREHPPRRIGLSIGSRRGIARGLSHDTYLLFAKLLGPEAESRFASAEPLIEEYLDTRLPEEAPHFETLVALTEWMARRALSNEAIVPGRTTVGDVRLFLYDALWTAGVTTWFQPDLRLQRRGRANAGSRGFLAVSKEAEVIERGDLVHLDFGITYMGMDSDWQKMAYVLRDGETDAPAGLKRALANTNALQDALLRAGRPGRPAGEVYQAVMDEMKAKDIEAMVYAHPLGNHGHGMGPSIDFRAAKRERGNEARPLREGSWLAVELNTATAVPEWDGQKVYVMQEDPARLTAEGYRFFRPRQESFYLVR
jgi:Xaa-Pro aminopeptidase